MKMLKLIAAATLALSGVAAAAPAEAQRYGHSRYDNRDNRGDQRWDRGNHRGRGWDRDRGYNRHRSNRVCRIVWRHHERVRVCYRR